MFTKRSTITNIILYLHEIYLMYDNKSVNNLSSLYRDFEKAFDKFNHLKLIEKLSHTGFSGACLGLLKNYLSDRYQQVRIGHWISKLLPITSGVPQGSILGPLMFILYINYLPTVAMSNCFGYADDYKIVSDNAITLNIDSNEIWNWCSKNFTCLNLSKCKTLQFKGGMSVCMKKQNIPGTDLMKDLGIIVTNNLSWTEHAKTRSAKSLKAFFSLKRNLANSSTISTKKNAYRGYVVPIISYASSLWKPSKSELALSEKVQHRASIWI